ncbi:metal ABC transporter substrate-binding protein [Armatimonas sp.]|uniref:metal ABC transporter substrate-binding protein n=1 Tax=Armatimonas sp. TaxID=1872638 RepID=UPI00374CEAF8
MEIITTTPELAAIARELVGNLATVTSLAKPEANYHQIDAKPSDVVRVARADVFIRCGLDLDMWADALLGSARNPKVQRGAAGYVDASARVRKLEVPTGGINGASGDVHPAGNPHYWFDPKDAVVVAYEILLALLAVDKAHGATYNANYKRFSDEITARLVGWTKTLAPFKGHGFVAYHDEWIYFATRFGLTPFGFLEPKPGIPPSGGHVTDLIQRMRASKVRAVVMGSIYSTKYADLIAKEAGGKVAVVPYSVGGMGTRSYFDYIDAIVTGFAKALS